MRVISGAFHFDWGGCGKVRMRDRSGECESHVFPRVCSQIYCTFLERKDQTVDCTAANATWERVLRQRDIAHLVDSTRMKVHLAFCAGIFALMD